MTPEKLKKIKDRLAAATPGPWSWSGCSNARVDVASNAPGWEGAEIAIVTVDYEFNERQLNKGKDDLPVMDRAMAHDNAALIYNAPQDLSELVVEVERLQKQCDEAKAALRLLWEEATDVASCYNMASASYQHYISEPCRAAVNAVLGGDR